MFLYLFFNYSSIYIWTDDHKIIHDMLIYFFTTASPPSPLVLVVHILYRGLRRSSAHVRIAKNKCIEHKVVTINDKITLTRMSQ